MRYPTMPAFGGSALDTIYVTSASWPLSPPERQRHPQEGNLFALAAPLRTGFYVMDLGSGAIRALASAPFDPRRFIFNDGGYDRAGRFLAGPMYVPLAPEPKNGPQEAAPWRYDGGERWAALTRPVATSNGLAWSPTAGRCTKRIPSSVRSGLSLRFYHGHSAGQASVHAGGCRRRRAGRGGG